MYINYKINSNSRLQFIIITILIILGFAVESNAAPHKSRTGNVVGIVVDSITGERLSFVNIYSKKNKQSALTDDNGVFKLNIPIGAIVETSSLGYEIKAQKIKNFNDTLIFRLLPSSYALQEVVIKPKKQKYSKKNNPAVELMRQVREDREKHDAKKQEYFSYDHYDKMTIGLNNYKGYLPGNEGKIKGKNKFLVELVDTGIWTGKRILDISMKEKYSTTLYSDKGDKKREIITAQRANGIDKGLDDNYTRAFFDDILREVDIYANDIPVMKNRFVSPLSAIGADYYMYHITDTVQIGDDKCVELSFAPHNPESHGFNGKLYIPVNDSIKYVRRAMMRLPKASNVNFVQNMYLSQNFKRDSIGNTYKTLDDMVVEMSLVGSVGEVYLSRQSRYDNHSYERRSDLSDYYNKIGYQFVIDEASNKDAEFWNNVRMVPLSAAEIKFATDESPFKKSKFLYIVIKGIELLVKGYVPTGKKSYFDFGPIDTFVSYNAPEGWRFAVGGLTTANLFKHVFGRGYVAYGLHDKKLKYQAELEYSFVEKKYHSREFPMNGIRATYRYDINKLGQHYMTNNATNLLNAVKRMESDLVTYERFGSLEYNIEWRNNLSFHASVNHNRQYSSPYVKFVDGYGNETSTYSENSVKLKLRWAPGEKFMQTYNERRNINRDAWTFALTHEFGPKGLMGSKYTLNLTELLVQKRIWFSAFGYADIIFKGAKLWNQVQFPALLWQNANIAYTMQSETYSLLNPMEFAMDEYVSLDLNYNMNGLIFNRIPLLKKAKIREVITFKGFWGHLTKRNNPAYHDNLFRFPEGSGEQMGKLPYMEMGVGIDNICSLFRLDYIWRLTYRNKKGAPNSGLRFSISINF